MIDTHELVVPKSIPMTSLPEAARAAADVLRFRKKQSKSVREKKGTSTSDERCQQKC